MNTVGQPSLKPANTGPFRKLVVFGESNVQGGGWIRTRSERWADILAHLLELAQEQPLAYHNAGVGGSVIAPSSPQYAHSGLPSAAERLDQEVIDHKPDLLLIAYGLNDMRSATPPDLFERELVDILRRVRERIDPVIALVNVYYCPTYRHYPPYNQGSPEATQTYNTLLERVARERQCLYIDIWSALAGADHLIHLDTVHANKIGNMLIANRVFESLARALPGISTAVREREPETSWGSYALAWHKDGKWPGPWIPPAEFEATGQTPLSEAGGLNRGQR